MALAPKLGMACPSPATEHQTTGSATSQPSYWTQGDGSTAWVVDPQWSSETTRSFAETPFEYGSVVSDSPCVIQAAMPWLMHFEVGTMRMPDMIPTARKTSGISQAIVCDII